MFLFFVSSSFGYRFPLLLLFSFLLYFLFHVLAMPDSTKGGSSGGGRSSASSDSSPILHLPLYIITAHVQKYRIQFHITYLYNSANHRGRVSCYVLVRCAWNCDWGVTEALKALGGGVYRTTLEMRAACCEISTPFTWCQKVDGNQNSLAKLLMEVCRPPYVRQVVARKDG